MSDQRQSNSEPIESTVEPVMHEVEVAELYTDHGGEG